MGWARPSALLPLAEPPATRPTLQRRKQLSKHAGTLLGLTGRTANLGITQRLVHVVGRLAHAALQALGAIDRIALASVESLFDRAQLLRGGSTLARSRTAPGGMRKLRAVGAFDPARG